MVRSEIAVVIPAFNEALTIGPVVAGASGMATVIVVDDCSEDGTSDIAKRNGALVLRNSQNQGYEFSLNRGFTEALRLGKQGIISMDADGEHDVADLPLYIDALLEKQISLVLGVRKRKQRFGEVIMGGYVRLAYGPKDILCGFKGYSSHIVKGNNGSFDSSKAVGTELALKELREGGSFYEVNVNIKPRKDTPRFDNVLRANLRILVALGKLIFRDMRKIPRR